MQSNPTHLKTLLYQCRDWLAEYAHENLGTEIVLSNIVSGKNWGLHVSRSGNDINGVSLVMPGKNWFLEASTPNMALALAALTCRNRRPEKLTCAGNLASTVRPFLLDTGGISREHYLDVMIAKERSKTSAGQWAEVKHIPALKKYQKAYNSERKTRITPDWEKLVQNKQVAVLEKDGVIVSAVKRSGASLKYACIGGTFTFDEYRRQKYASQLTGFIVNELLDEKSAVHLIVDDDNEAAAKLYRRIGFVNAGQCYMAYLR